MNKLKDKVALVTSGTRGIGLQCVKTLAQNGATVYIGARRLEVANEIWKDLLTQGFIAKSVYFDATKTETYESMIDNVIKDDVCRLIISVEDSGIGIKSENIDKLFSKFERFDLEQNITIEGTGLGLAITKRLVDLMNGKIVVQSVYGKGSKFTVAIDQKSETEIEIFDASDKKVLVVDDNKINLKVASRLLSNYNVQLETCESGFECIEKIDKGASYDLILMDDMMPRMSGVETFHNLRDKGVTIPCVALTANAISGMKEKYLNEGFNDYLSKPIDKLELNIIMKKYLKK